jgi:3'(2'),5'-bisphosphate nucleotidase
MTPTAESLQCLCDIARAAGAAIMAEYQPAMAVATKPDDSPVTQADLSADAIIRERLTRQFPGMSIVSEESASGTTAPAEPYFLVDPLDGTREFIEGNGEFTVNIALISAGRPLAGVVYAPAIAHLYYGAEGVGAWRDDGSQITPLKARSISIGSPLRITGSRKHGANELSAWMAGLPLPTVLVPAGSSLKFCLIAEGSADIYPRLAPTYPWDTAAGQCVLECAGGQVTDWQGNPLQYPPGLPQPNPYFIATGPRNSLTAQLLSATPVSTDPRA